MRPLGAAQDWSGPAYDFLHSVEQRLGLEHGLDMKVYDAIRRPVLASQDSARQALEGTLDDIRYRE